MKISKDKYLMGIDLGTSSVKAGLLNMDTGELGFVETEKYDEYSEYDSQVLWDKTFSVVAKVVKRINANDEIKSIGIAGQMHGAILFGANEQIIEPLINWRDTKRYSPQVLEEMNRIVGDEGAQNLGMRMAPGLTGVILFWIKENDPGLFRKIEHFVLFSDFIRAKLLGKNDFSTDQTNASGTGLFNTRLNQWHDTVIRKLGIPVEIFPSVQRTSSVAGYLADEWVRLLHLSVDIPVIFGGGDNQLSMLGSGLISPNSPALINIGTGAQISKVSSVFQKIMGVEVRPFFDGQFALVSASLGGGGHYQQLRDSFIARGIMLDYAEMDALAKGVPAGSEGLMYCSGPSRSQPQRKRGFFGNMEKITSPGHQARAVMEGVLMDLYEADQLMGQDGEQEWLIGSGKALQQSQVWAQIAADLFGRGLQIPYVETAILGVALAAGWSAKELGDKQIWQQSINYGEIIRPDPLKTNFYKEQFARLWLTKANQFSGSSLTS